jgi:hypothetical protein
VKSKILYIIFSIIFIVVIVNCDPKPVNPYNYSYLEDFEKGNFKNPEYWSDIFSNGSPAYPPILSAIENPAVFEKGSGLYGKYSMRLDARELLEINFDRIQVVIDIEVTGTENSFMGFEYKVSANPTEFFGAKSEFRFTDRKSGGTQDPILTVTDEVDWTHYELTLTPGKHELCWAFFKILSNEVDSVWIDDIGFGENVEIISIKKQPELYRDKIIEDPQNPGEYIINLTKINDDNDSNSDIEDEVYVKTNGQEIEYLLYNQGKLNLQVTDITTNSSNFSIIEPTSFPITIEPFKNSKVTININNPSVGTETAKITINTDANSPLDVYEFDLKANIVTPPSAPSGFNVNSDRYIELNWNDGPTDIMYYEVWRTIDNSGAPNQNEYIQLYERDLLNNPVRITQSEFNDNYGLPNQLYWYKIRIITNTGVASDFSSELSGSNNLTFKTLTLDPNPWQNGELPSYPITEPATCEWWYIDTLTIGTTYYLYWEDYWDNSTGEFDDSFADIKLEVYKTNGNDKYELVDGDFGYPEGPITEEGNGEIIVSEESELWIRVYPYSSFYTGPYTLYFGTTSQN